MLVFALAFLPLALATTTEYFDILGSGSPEWRLAFRGTAHVEKSLYDAYRYGHGIPSAVEDGCKGIDYTKPCNSHYRNDDALDKWENVKDILIGVIDHDAMVKTFIFSGYRSTFLDYMKPDRLIDSDYVDLKNSSYNYFGLDGHEALQRRFFINHQYAGCSGDMGWLVAADSPSPSCPWESSGGKYPVIRYALGPKREKYSTELTGLAKAIVVFLRYNPTKGEPSEYFDLLNSGKEEWRLVFRGTAHIETSVYEAYKTGSNVPVIVDEACKTMDFFRPCYSHYRNFPALDDGWKNVDQVLYGIIDNGVLAKYVIFDGQGSTYMNFFDQQRLLRSCYEDLDKQTTTNYFSIAGDDKLERRFFISHQYNSCQLDEAWMVAVDRPSVSCNWEKGYTYPYFKYSALPTLENLNHYPYIKDAEAMVIFVKYLDM